MTAKPRIGFLGAGLMGRGICKNLIEHGHAVTLLAHRNRAVIDELVGRGAHEAASLAALVAASDIVMACLPDVKTTERVLGGPAGVIALGRDGLTIVDCSTSDPALTSRLGDMATARGMVLVDAPLMRGPREAWAGELNVIVGGTTDVVERLKPVFACFAKTIFHVGSLGQGHRVKILNNAISMCNLATVAEAIVAAATLGIDRQLLLDVVSSGNATSKALTELGPRLIADNHAMSFSVNVGLKDIELFRRMVNEAGGLTLLGDAARDVFWLASKSGFGAENSSRIGTALAGLAGVEVKQV